jgi:hypothetical protein
MKGGTTLMQHLVYQVLTRGAGDLVADETPLYCLSPWLESYKTLSTEEAPLLGSERPSRLIKTHLPAHLCPFHQAARYIYVVRHPVSCFMSCVDSISDNLGRFAPPLSEFESWYGSEELMWWTTWPAHVGEWLRRHEQSPNVLFFRFEDVTKNLSATAKQLASFLDMEELSDSEHLEIVRKCSFGYMQAHAETFEMSPPHILQANGKFFFSGRADRYQSVPDDVRDRIVQRCREYGLQSFSSVILYPDLVR